MKLSFGNTRLNFLGNVLTFPKPSETPAIAKMQNFWTAINAYIVEWDALPLTQGDLSGYMNFNPDGAYTFTYTGVSDEFGYLNAISSSPYIHSFTRTVTYDTYGLQNIICEKLGTVPPGAADYSGGVLSCPLGTEEI